MTAAASRMRALHGLPVGAILVGVFTLMSSFRDVFLAGVFRERPLLLVLLLTFALTNLLFAPLAARLVVTRPCMLRASWRLVGGVNVTTAAAWILYFGALELTPPAVAITIWSSAGPLFLIVLQRRGWAVSGNAIVRRRELTAYALLFALCIFLALGDGARAAVADGHAGRLAGNLLALASGLSVTLAVLQSQRLGARGFTSAEIMGLRFHLTAALALGGALASGAPLMDWLDPSLASTAALVTLLIVLPNFILQVGLLRTSALTAKVISAFGPILTFGMQALILGVPFEAPVIAGVACFAALTILGAHARWRNV